MNVQLVRRNCALAAATVLAVLAAGCTAQQQARSKSAPPPAPTPAPEAGFRTARAAFPTGNPNTSVILVEKTVPTEVLAGQPFEVVYKISNLTDLMVQDVTLHAQAGENFKAEDATPEPDETSEGKATWVIGDLPPRQSREIRVRGSALEEGVVTGCGSVTFNPVLCETIKVLKPAIELVKTMPAQVIQCDPIPVRLTVRNTGSSSLTDVRVTDSLPNGLLSEAGQSSVAFDAGTLAPGQSKEFAFKATAARTGKFSNPARVTSAQGVEASAQASITVVKPVLTLECETPALKEMGNLKFTEFIGRPFQVCWEVKNTGDAPSVDTVLLYALSPELTLRSATDGGAVVGGNVTWNLGTLAPGASKKVCATLAGTRGGDYRLSAKVTGACAEPGMTGCNVIIQGISAILVEVVDDPDPIQVGEETTYLIKVTNQGGGLDLQDVVVKAIFPDGMAPGAASNNAQVSGKTVTWPTVAALPLRETLTYTVKGKALKAGDNRLQVEVSTRQRPAIIEVESTTAY